MFEKEISGWINFYKPSGISSNNALKLVKKKLNIKKAGYLGTLDPLAEGILPIAIGKSTKEIPLLLENLKEYEFAIKWGEKTNTGDRAGTIIQTSSNYPTEATICSILPQFTGEILQSPHPYSAIKINGKRAYKLAREGHLLTLCKRKVYIHSLELVEIPRNEIAVLKVCCGKGVYVRSLAEDIAEMLGSCAYVLKLCRTYYYPFYKQSSVDLDNLSSVNILTSECVLSKSILIS